MSVFCQEQALWRRQRTRQKSFNEGIEQMDQATPTDAVIWRVDERGVAYITLNRPQVYNAYNDDLIAALLIAFGSWLLG